MKRKPWEENKLKRLLSDTLLRIIPHEPIAQTQPLDAEPGVMKFPIKETYVGTNENGDHIYALGPDNMLCLVPNKNTTLNMPVAGSIKLGNKSSALLNNMEDNNGNPGILNPNK